MTGVDSRGRKIYLCRECGRRRAPGRGVCSGCYRKTNGTTVAAEREKATAVEPVQIIPMTAERIIEQWGRA